MPTVVITPPKHPNLSIRMTSAPALRAARAADSPDGPPPTTSTSHLIRIDQLDDLFKIVNRNAIITMINVLKMDVR